MPRVIHFEIPAEDLDRAQAFYNTVFEWEITGWGGQQQYRLVSTGPDDTPGIDGGLIWRQEPHLSTVNVVGVPSLDEFVTRVENAGGVVVFAPMEIAGVGRVAYCKDTEGNVFGMLEPEESDSGD